MASYDSANDLDTTYLELARLLHSVFLESNSEVIDGIIPSKAKNPPASKDFISNLSSVSSKELEKCSICLGPFTRKQLVKELPKCNHYFHADCILPWLGQTNTCPMCRHEYPTDDMEYEEKRRLKEKEKEREELLEELHNSMFS